MVTKRGKRQYYPWKRRKKWSEVVIFFFFVVIDLGWCWGRQWWIVSFFIYIISYLWRESLRAIFVEVAICKQRTSICLQFIAAKMRLRKGIAHYPNMVWMQMKRGWNGTCRCHLSAIYLRPGWSWDKGSHLIQIFVEVLIEDFIGMNNIFIICKSRAWITLCVSADILKGDDHIRKVMCVWTFIRGNYLPYKNGKT